MQLLKATFTTGATLCLVQLVCTSPAGSAWRLEGWPKEDEFPSDDRIYALLMASMMTCETLASAENTHCYPMFLPKSLESDRRNHVVASSTVELWSDLRAMESVQNVYAAMADTYMRHIENEDAVNMWFRRMDKGMAEDPRLCQRYKQLKSKYETLVVLESDHLEKEKLVTSASRQNKTDKNTRFKQLELNFNFAQLLNNNGDVNGSDKDEKYVRQALKFRALAKTMVEMSKSDDRYEKLQQMYRESLADVATNVETIGIADRASVALYRKLRQRVKADPAIKAEFEEKKKGILKKLKEKA